MLIYCTIQNKVVSLQSEFRSKARVCLHTHLAAARIGDIGNRRVAQPMSNLGARAISNKKRRRRTMSAQENQQRAMAYIAEQSGRAIDYQWEIQHHRQMHAAYENR